MDPTDQMKAPFQAVGKIGYAPGTPPAPWDGMPANPDQDGWHWIKLYLSGQGMTGCYFWEGSWVEGGTFRSPDEMATDLRTEYLGPATPPKATKMAFDAYYATLPRDLVRKLSFHDL